MIKRLFLVSCMALAALAGRAERHNVEVDGITYMVDTETGTATVTGYTVRPVDVVILATVGYEGTDYPVTSIGKRAFFGRASVESVLLPDGLQCIEDSAFYGCRPMTSIVLPKSLQSIGNHAFARTKLQSIVLPEGLQTIGLGTFWTCDSLQSVTFLGSLQAIGREAFYECFSLQSITFPEGLQSIGDYAFAYCTSLASVTLPEGLQSIGSMAFRGCSALQSINIPEGMAHISGAAFEECTSLQSIIFPSSLQAIDGSFLDCPLKNITCHAVTPPAISEYTFDAVTCVMANLTVPSEAETAYKEAEGWKLFYTSFVSDNVIYFCDPQTCTATVAGYTGNLVKANIPQTIDFQGSQYAVTAIDGGAFGGCTSLEEITLPEGLAEIGSSAFIGCTSLAAVTCHALVPPMPDSYYLFSSNPFDADTYNKAVLSVPADTRKLYQAASVWMDFFEKVTLDDIVYSVDREAMSAVVVDHENTPANASVLAAVEYEGSAYNVVAIGDQAFYNCMSLASVTLPEGLQSIGNKAFYYCDALKSITLPSTLQSIGEGLGESGLVEIISKAVVPPAASRSTFVNYAGINYADISVHVPEGAEAAYQKDQYWREFWLHPVVDGVHYDIDPDAMTVAVARCEDDITEAVVVPSFAFAGEDVLVTSIDAWAFYTLSSLKSVTLPEGLESIGLYAFKGCMALENVICFAAVPPMMNEVGDGTPFSKDTYEIATPI